MFGIVGRDGRDVFSKSRLIQSVGDKYNYPLMRYADKNILLGKHKFFEIPGLHNENKLVESSGLVVVSSSLLDNRVELADVFGIKRVDLPQFSDSELIRRAYLRWGKDCAQRLDGMFAFAVWDNNRELLYLARDQAGNGSLYYVWNEDFFAFASTQKQLLVLGEKYREVNVMAISRLIKEKGIYPIPESEYHKTIYENILKLPPGHFATLKFCDFAALKLTKYYDLEDNVKLLRLKTNREYEEAYLDCINSAVLTALGGQTAVASEMSSGFDSSVVSCLAADELKKSGVRLNSYVFSPSDKNGLQPISAQHLVDEFPLAKIIADFNGNIDLTACVQGEGNAYALIDDCLDWLETPVYNFCNMGWILNIRRRAAKDGAKIILNASMGNMIISCGNYSRSVGQLLKERRLMTLTGLVANRFAHTPLSWTGFKVAVAPLLRYYKPKRKVITDESPLWRDLCGSVAKFAQLDEYCKTFDDYLRLYVYASIYGNKPSAMLQMAESGIIVRDPLQSRKVFEFARSMPPEQWALDYNDRSLIRRSSIGLLPDEKRLSNSRGLQGTDWLKQLAPDWPKVLDAARIALRQPQIGELVNENAFVKCIERNAKLDVFEHQSADVREIMQLVVLGRFFQKLD